MTHASNPNGVPSLQPRVAEGCEALPWDNVNKMSPTLKGLWLALANILG